jgi:hypothetical protein
LVIFRRSFRPVAGGILPLTLLFSLVGCGSAARHAAKTRAVAGAGFMVEIPAGWRLERTGNGIVAHGGGSFVSVARFALRKPYDPSEFPAAAPELDRVAAELAAKAQAAVTERHTTTIAGRQARAYAYGRTRVAFVLVARREYELLCVAQSDACALLFSSFTVS